jgi:hypothetical protein
VYDSHRITAPHILRKSCSFNYVIIHTMVISVTAPHQQTQAYIIHNITTTRIVRALNTYINTHTETNNLASPQFLYKYSKNEREHSHTHTLIVVCVRCCPRLLLQPTWGRPLTKLSLKWALLLLLFFHSVLYSNATKLCHHVRLGL